MVVSHPPVIVLDACVLTASIRRHLLLVCAEARLFIPVWSKQIIHETRRAIPKALNASAVPAHAATQHAETVCALMRAAFPEAEHSLSYNGHLPDLPDPDDVHVVALALSAHSKIIVTENLRDFPSRRLAPFGISAINADAFLSELFEQTPHRTTAIIRRLQHAINRDEVDRIRMIARMKSVGLKKTAKILSAE